MRKKSIKIEVDQEMRIPIPIQIQRNIIKIKGVPVKTVSMIKALK